MTDYTINGTVVREIKIKMPDGKVITIIPNDEVAKSDIILFPIRSKGGEFTHNMPIIGYRGIDNVLLPTSDHTVYYSPKGEDVHQPLIHIHGERANR